MAKLSVVFTFARSTPLSFSVLFCAIVVYTVCFKVEQLVRSLFSTVDAARVSEYESKKPDELFSGSVYVVVDGKTCS